MSRGTHLVVIDGPAGAGKSTVARLLARRLGVPLLDTGAIYRTLALVAEQRGVAWDDEAGLTELAQDFPIAFGQLREDDPPDAKPGVTFGEQDVTAAIRTPNISQGASMVSAHPGVRKALMGIQRALGAQGCVAEGRDMGTVVFPAAPYKFFLTADVRTRAQRRLAELEATGDAASLQEVMADIEERDLRDSSREASPLQQAPDAVRIDTSGLGVQAVIEALLHAMQQP